jgi:hypothetical protein
MAQNLFFLQKGKSDPDYFPDIGLLSERNIPYAHPVSGQNRFKQPTLKTTPLTDTGKILIRN